MNFSTVINKKDHGYLVKDFGEKGWGLFDLQTLSVQTNATNTKTSGQQNNLTISINAFTDLLSKVTNDPSLKLVPAVTNPEEKKSEIVSSTANDVKEEPKEQPKEPPVIKTEEKEHRSNKYKELQ